MLTPDTTLYRAPDLVIKVNGSNNLRLYHEGRILKLGPEALSLIDVLHSPTTVTEALKRAGLRLGGERSTKQMLDTLSALVQAEVLTTEPLRRFSRELYPTYDSALVHLTILNDTERKGAFVRAVQEIVRPGDVVLDLGAGSGILAITAAKAGARRVYAVEPASMMHLAERVAHDNGVADQITFMREWSTRVELPEKANVLTTDLVGNEALDMLIWENIQDARQRLLTADARIMPDSLSGFAMLVEIPNEIVAKHRVDHSHLRAWQENYGINFGALMESERQSTTGFYERPETVRQWVRLSEPTSLYELNLRTDVDTIDQTCTLTAKREGTATGVVVFFRAKLSPSVIFSTDPSRGSDSSHWFTATWALPEAVPLRVGDRLPIRFRYFGEGHERLDLMSTKESKGDDSREAT